uniref:Peripherin 2-like a n=1 Tax=Cyprinodon variegatus TaxID=28743 RepID=A0A3Q2G0U9_CYPVA
MAVLKVKFTKTRRDKLAQILWILNWISVVTGVILFSLGLFLKVELKKREELMAEKDIQYVPNMLIAVGLIACVINFLGGKICYDCVDTTKFLRWKLILLPYIVCTFFFTLCVLVGALMCYSMHWELEEALNLGLMQAMRFYKDTDMPGRCFLKHTVDMLQIQFQCCGNSGYKDWQGDPNSESDGWLLENSLMETARTNLNIIKSLGKNNQINSAENGDPNIDVPSTSAKHYGSENVSTMQKMGTG